MAKINIDKEKVELFKTINFEKKIINTVVNTMAIGFKILENNSMNLIKELFGKEKDISKIKINKIDLEKAELHYEDIPEKKEEEKKEEEKKPNIKIMK